MEGFTHQASFSSFFLKKKKQKFSKGPMDKASKKWLKITRSLQPGKLARWCSLTSDFCWAQTIPGCFLLRRKTLHFVIFLTPIFQGRPLGSD
jgi:hypothetical protein